MSGLDNAMLALVKQYGLKKQKEVLEASLLEFEHEIGRGNPMEDPSLVVIVQQKIESLKNEILNQEKQTGQSVEKTPATIGG